MHAAERKEAAVCARWWTSSKDSVRQRGAAAAPEGRETEDR